MALTRRLDEIELRIAGALMEKEVTTPEGYPLTEKSLLAACNQLSNRDPVLSLSPEEVTNALDRLRRDVLVWRSQSTRSTRWEHRLASRWNLDRPAQAVMTLLLLRGPQTPGELRSRSGRLCSFGEVGEVEAVLRRLARGEEALVRELARVPGQRENRWCHVMGSGEATVGAKAAAISSMPQDRAQSPIPGTRAVSGEPSPPHGELPPAVMEPAMEATEEHPKEILGERSGKLEERFGKLEERVRKLEAELAKMLDQLGGV